MYEHSSHFYRDVYVGKNSVKYLAAAILSVTVATPVMGVCETLAGAYLAARQADLARDYTASEQYYGSALLRDSSNPNLLESQIMAYIYAMI